MVIPYGLIVEKHGLVGERGDVLVLHTDFAVERFQEGHLDVFDEVVDHAVEVGELVAFGVHFPVIRVSVGDGPGRFLHPARPKTSRPR